MPFGAAVGAAVAGGLASGAVGLGGSAIAGGKASAGGAQAQQTLALQRADLAPYRDTGANALGIAGDLSGANGPDAARAAQSDFIQSPGYQWQLGEGLRAVDAGAAAKGMLRSGATIKGEEAYGQGLAKQDFTSYYNRLFDLTKLGETAAVGGDATANTSATLAQGAGNTQGSIFGNAAQGLGSTVSGLLSNPKVQNSLFGGGSGNFNLTSTGNDIGFGPGLLGPA